MKLIVLVRNKEKLLGLFPYGDVLFEILEQDISEPIKCSKAIDYYLIGATNAYPDAYDKTPVEIMKSNLFGLENAFFHAKTHNCESRVVFLSSSEVYGEYEVGMIGVFENFIGLVNQMNPRSCYSESKRASETLCVSYAKEYGIESVILRPGYIFGPGFQKKNNRADADFFSKAARQEEIVLNSKGEQIRSYCYVGNMANAILLAITNGMNMNAYNVAGNTSISIKEFAYMISEYANVPIVINDGNGSKGGSLFSKAILNIEKIKNIGYKPIIDIQEGIKLTLEHLKKSEFY